MEIWVPLHYIHYWEGPQDWTPSGNDEVNAKSLINDPEGASEETPSSKSLPDVGSSENMTRQADQTLKSKRNIITAPGLIDQALEALINLRQVSGLIRTYC